MKRIISVTIVILLVASSSFATTIIRKDFDRQAIEADLIVVGSPVASEEIRWNGFPCTRLTIRVEEVIAGEKVGNEISIIQPGTGQVRVLGVKILVSKTNYLLLLEKLPDGNYRLVGFNQGAHRVAVERKSNRKVVIIKYSRRAAPGMTLDAAKKRIRAMRKPAENKGQPK